MEAHDVFNDEPATDDVFAGGDFGDFDTETATQTLEEPRSVAVEELAVVDREGQPVTDAAKDPEPALPAQEQPAVAAVPEPEAVASQPAAGTESEVEIPEGEKPGGSEPAEPEDAPEPVAKKGRKYTVLQEIEPGVFKLVSWLVDREGNMVPKNTRGARKQSVAVGHSTEDALKIAYAGLGSPAGGVRLAAVAQLHFQVKTVAPSVVEPVKVKLSIS